MSLDEDSGSAVSNHSVHRFVRWAARRVASAEVSCCSALIDRLKLKWGTHPPLTGGGGARLDSRGSIEGLSRRPRTRLSASPSQTSDGGLKSRTSDFSYYGFNAEAEDDSLRAGARCTIDGSMRHLTPAVAKTLKPVGRHLQL